MAGFIKVDRDILDSEQFQEDWLCRLWLWCLLRANYEPALYRGQLVQPGQFVVGRIAAAAELNVNPSKWYRGIERLVAMGSLATEANKNWTTITVCNWERFQGLAAVGKEAAEPVPAALPPEKPVKAKKPKPPPEPTPEMDLPECLQTPEFGDAWVRWQSHRKEIKKPLTPLSAAQQIKELTALGPARSVAAIDHSIRSGWRGIFEDRGRDAKPSGRELFGGINDFVNGR